jgi:hypothetical protein
LPPYQNIVTTTSSTTQPPASQSIVTHSKRYNPNHALPSMPASFNPNAHRTAYLSKVSLLSKTAKADSAANLIQIKENRQAHVRKAQAIKLNLRQEKGAASGGGGYQQLVKALEHSRAVASERERREQRQGNNSNNHQQSASSFSSSPSTRPQHESLSGTGASNITSLDRLLFQVGKVTQPSSTIGRDVGGGPSAVGSMGPPRIMRPQTAGGGRKGEIGQFINDSRPQTANDRFRSSGGAGGSSNNNRDNEIIELAYAIRARAIGRTNNNTTDDDNQQQQQQSM